MPVRGFFPAGHNDPFVESPVRSAPSWPLPVIQTRPADGQRRGHQCGGVALRHHLSCLGVDPPPDHSPPPFFWILIFNAFPPIVGLTGRVPWSFSLSAPSPLLPPRP